MADYTEINRELAQFLREVEMVGLLSTLFSDPGERAQIRQTIPVTHAAHQSMWIGINELISVLKIIDGMIRTDYQDPIRNNGLKTLKKIRNANRETYDEGIAELTDAAATRINQSIDELEDDAADDASSVGSHDSEVIINGLAAAPAAAAANRFNLGNNNNGAASPVNGSSSVAAANTLAEKRKVIAIAAYKYAVGAVLKDNTAFIQSKSNYWTSGRYVTYSNGYTDIALTGKSAGFVRKSTSTFEVETEDVVYDVVGLPPEAKAVYAGPAENFMIQLNDDSLIFAKAAPDGSSYGVFMNVLKAASPADYYNPRGNRKPGAVILLKTGEAVEVGGTSADLSGSTVVPKPADLRLKDICMGYNYYVGIDMDDKLVGWGDFMKDYDGTPGIIPKIAASITYTPKKVFTCNYKIVVVDSEDLIHIYSLMNLTSMVAYTEAREVDIPEPFKSIKVLDIACANDFFVALTDQEKLYASEYENFRKYTDEQGPLYDVINLLDNFTDTRVLEARFDKVIEIVANEMISGAVTEEGRVYAWGNGGHGQLDTFGGEYHYGIDKLAFTYNEGAVLKQDNQIEYWDDRGHNDIANILPTDYVYTDIVGSEMYFVGLDEDGHLHSNKPTDVPLPTEVFSRLYCNGNQAFAFWKADRTILCYNDLRRKPAIQPPAGTKFKEVAIAQWYGGADELQYVGIELETNNIIYWGQNASLAGMPTKGRSVTHGGIGFYIVDLSGRTFVYDTERDEAVQILEDLDVERIVASTDHFVVLLTNGHVVSGSYDDGEVKFGTKAHTRCDLSVVDSQYERYSLPAAGEADDNNNSEPGSPAPRASSPRAAAPAPRAAAPASSAAASDPTFFARPTQISDDKTYVLPRLEKLDSAEVPKPEDTSIFDFGSGNQYDDYIDFLEDQQGDALIFKIGNKLMGGSKKAVGNSIADDSAIFYECRKVFPFNPTAGLNGRFMATDIKRDSITMINLNGRFYVRTSEVLGLFAANQFFELEETEEEILATASREAAIYGGPLMSMNHCQDGTNIKLHTLRPVKFVRVAEEEEEEEEVPNIVYVHDGSSRIPIDVPGKTTVRFVKERFAELKGVPIERIKLIKFGQVPVNTNAANPGDNFMGIVKPPPEPNAAAGGGRTRRRKWIGSTRRLRKDIVSRF